MSWVLPVPLLLLAGVVALLPLATLVRRPVTLPLLMVEVFAVTLGVIATIWVGWALLWVIEQRW